MRVLLRKHVRKQEFYVQFGGVEHSVQQPLDFARLDFEIVSVMGSVAPPKYALQSGSYGPQDGSGGGFSGGMTTNLNACLSFGCMLCVCVVGSQSVYTWRVSLRHAVQRSFRKTRRGELAEE